MLQRLIEIVFGGGTMEVVANGVLNMNGLPGADTELGRHLTNAGTMDLGVRHIKQMNGANITNTGLMEAKTAITIKAGGGGNPIFQNNGTLIVDMPNGGDEFRVDVLYRSLGGKTTIKKGKFRPTNLEQTSLQGTIELAGGDFSSPGAVWNYGLIDVINSCSFVASGGLTNVGTIGFDYYSGYSNETTATMTIEGNVTLDSSGYIYMKLRSPTAYDRMVINGTAALAGTLTVRAIGFDPSPYSFNGLFSFTSATSEFTNASLPAGRVLRYNPTSIDLINQT